LQKLLTKIDETGNFKRTPGISSSASLVIGTIDQQLIVSAVKQWRKCLAACVSARGGHLEHMQNS